MVNKKNDSQNEQIDNNEIVAEKPVKKTAKAAPKTSKTAAEKPARKPAAKKPAASKAEAEGEATAETTEPAAKKPAARRSSKAAKPAAEGETSAEATAPAAPASSFGLMFMAPDLPTPVVDPKKGHIIDQPAADGESHLRRRSRRRAGESVDGELAPNTVVKVREPRAPKEPSNEPQRVKGSTRLEAKKQRRRDGRDAGRRRTVITESEFLARREAVDRTMVVRSKDGKIQIGVLEDGILVEHYVAKASEASLIGNVYMGKIQNVLPSMEAAFVDIGRGRNAVLYSGEVDWELAETGNQPRRIELALKSGDTVLVQVTKDPVGQKGARLTSQVSLPGRYLVYVPNGSMNGISRKLPDSERARLKKILKEILPEDAGVIVRTAAEGATEEQLTLDVQRLQAQWEDIQKKVEKGNAPAMLHSEPDLLVKIVRDVFNEDFQKMVISGEDARGTIEEYLASVAPDLLERVENYTGDKDVFDEYRVGEQIAKALDRKVYLPSGGSLVIDRTEAMTVVDVNTGKFVGSGGNLEETVTKNNLEAAEEIVRQLRLRDIGGIIVVDFIDMVLESNRDLVLRRLIECLSRDRTKHQVAEVTSLGLVQMTRKKLGIGLIEAFSEPCEACAGRGIIVHHEPIMRHKSQHPMEDNSGKSQKQSKKNRDRGGDNNKDKGSQKAPEAAKVVTPEKAVELGSVISKIAASTVAAHEAAGEPSPIVLPPVKSNADAPSADAAVSADAAAGSSPEQLLEAVLDALPEPAAPGQGKTQGRRKPRRASSGEAAPETE
ncbi:MAG: Rne/Rng family ribonuclease [Actinomycetales bacterium]|nr:Rne/Rng family ribonuclease [Actinomycetales bacterium]